MPFYRTRLTRYICFLLILVLLIILIPNDLLTSKHHYTYDAEIHQFIPESLRHIAQKSSASYTIQDLINITSVSTNIEHDQLNSAENPIHLITEWYHETNYRRRQELLLVLRMNVMNEAITKIHFIQKSDNCTIFDDIQLDQQFPLDLLKSKLIISYDRNSNETERLTVNQALQYANRFILTDYTILVNLDIFFDQSLSLLKHRSLLDRKTILYLSRYEVDPSITTLGLQCSDEHYVGSHDALIFQTPLSSSLIEQLTFEIGTWHIEVKIIYELNKADYIVRNTCKSIRIWHLHSSQIRHRLMPSKRYIADRHLDLTMRKPEFL